MSNTNNIQVDKFKELLQYWGYNLEVLVGNSFKVMARYKKSAQPDKKGNEYGFFVDVRDLKGNKLYYPNNLGEPRVFTRHKESYFGSEYWLVNVSMTKDYKRSKDNPYELVITDSILGKPKQELVDRIKQSRKNTRSYAKEHIEKRFRRLDNPDSNKMIANLMREIGKGMYSSKQRMIFELLQNADDAPGREKVEFHIDTKDDYLFVMHDGVEFSKEDVDAITSAAESTKRADKKKTGYKGIGFKSVFTDSKEVWIRSGKYQFAFLRNSNLFEDFDSLYLGQYRMSAEIYKKKSDQFAEAKSTFNHTTDVPWQVMPIWQNSLPQVFEETNFTRHRNNVQIAMNIGQDQIRNEGGYISAIGDILKKPQFILFLRNTSKFRSPKNGTTVLRNDNESVTEITKTVLGEENTYFTYHKESYCNIEISEAILKDVGILKVKESNELGETAYFTTLSGDRIETIPSKLAEATETEISLAFVIHDREISAEESYIDEVHKYSSLFAFLPMEDTRFQLPFLVNADFIPSSDRQTIQGDNPWNKYIITKIAEKHIESLSNFARKAADGESFYFNYLSLLLRNQLPEDETAQVLIDLYNNTYSNLLKEVPLIVNDYCQIQLLKDTVLDMSNMSQIFDKELFYEITKTKKKLPHSDLNISYLEDYSYLNVDKISLEDVSEIITPEVYELMSVRIKDFDSKKREDFARWSNSLAEIKPELVLEIPFLLYRDEVKSIMELSNLDDVFLVDSKTKKYKDILIRLGYEVIDVSFENSLYIKASIAELDSYVNNNQLMYERIAANSKLVDLSPVDKLILLDFFQNDDFMKGIGETKYFGELKIFKDEIGIARPLRSLIDYESYCRVKSLENFRMNRSEYGLVWSRFGKELISDESIFSKFILNEELFSEWSKQFNESTISDYVQDLIKLYDSKEVDFEPTSKDWNSIRWMFVDKEEGFKYSSEVFWSKAFANIDNKAFSTLCNCINQCDIISIPDIRCGKLIEKFSLAYSDFAVEKWDSIEKLDTESGNILLDWMGKDGNYGSFFQNFLFERVEDNHWCITENSNNKKIYTSIDNLLIEYITVNCEDIFSCLPSELSEEKRELLGVLQGDALILEIINYSLYNQSFANFLPKENRLEIIEKFVSNIAKFELSSGKEYDKSSPEYKVLDSLMYFADDESDVVGEVKNIIDKLKLKITVDGKSISEFNYSDKVFITINDIKIELSLSSILEEYKGESNTLSTLIDNFAIRSKGKLRELFFDTRIMTIEEIVQKINASKPECLSVYQTLFRVLISDAGNNNKISKKDFDENCRDIHIIQKGIIDFLDLLIIHEYYPKNFHVNKTVVDLGLCMDSSVAIESEILAEWLMRWKGQNAPRHEKLLSHFGYNGIDSSIVQMRHSMTTPSDYSEDSVIRFFDESKAQAQLLYNTLEWLSKYSSDIITRNIKVVEKICMSINLNASVSFVSIPIVSNIASDNSRTYSIEKIDVEKQLYCLQEKDKALFYDIYEAMHANCQLIDSKCGNLKGVLKNNKVIEINDDYDKELLIEGAELWNEPYYRKWKYCKDCQIYIYNGSEMPRIYTYESYTIKQYTEGLICKSDNCIYVSKKILGNIQEHLRGVIEQKYIDSLKDWHYETLKDETLLEEDNFEYNETIDRILQDRFGISEENQRDENNSSKQAAIYYLHKHGYDINNAIDNSYSIDNILTPEGDEVKFIVRGAKGGLLYIDEDHWRMLDNDDVGLIAIYPGGEPRVFTAQKELLMDDLAENVLFRVSNKKEVNYIDNTFNSLGGTAHLILVTSEKMKEDLFGRLHKSMSIVEECDSAIADDNFELD